MADVQHTTGRRRSPRTFAVVALLTFLAVLVGGCDHGSPHLMFPPPGVNGGSVGLPDVRSGEQWSIGMESTICLNKPGSVTITGVAPVDGTGIRVVGFAVRPNQNWKPTPSRVDGDFLGERHQSLRWLGFTGTTVDVACSKNSARGYELAIRVDKTTSGTGQAAGWLVFYRTGGHTGALAVPFGLTLAPGRLKGA